MQQSSGKNIKPQTPRSEIRKISGLSTRRKEHRPNSANLADRNTVRSIFGRKTRSTSANAKPEEPIEQETVEVEDLAPKHKQGCPWQKARPRSRYGEGVTESSSGIMHRKPWGARDPQDIPCFCHVTRDSKESNGSPSIPKTTKLTDIRPPGKSSKAKITDIVNNLGVFMEKRKIRIGENEIAFLMKKIEEKIQNFVDKTVKSTQKQNQKEQSIKQRNVQSVTPLQRQQPIIPQKTLSREQLLELPKNKMAGNVLGKMETKKYFLELTADNKIPTNFGNILGSSPTTIIHPHTTDKMLVALDDKQQAYMAVLPKDLAYSVKTMGMENYTGVQLHHQAENTTFLLAANPALARRNVPGLNQAVMTKPHNYKARRQ